MQPSFASFLNCDLLSSASSVLRVLRNPPFSLPPLLYLALRCSCGHPWGRTVTKGSQPHEDPERPQHSPPLGHFGIPLAPKVVPWTYPHGFLRHTKLWVTFLTPSLAGNADSLGFFRDVTNAIDVCYGNLLLVVTMFQMYLLGPHWGRSGNLWNIARF